MKTKVMLVLAIVLNVHVSVAQKSIDAQYLNSLPRGLNLIEKEPQKYSVTADYFNGDIFGNFVNKTRVTGNYTRGFKNGTVKWNRVSISNGTTREGPFANPTPQSYMENFTYKPSDKMLDAGSFPDFPPNSFHSKNLVWDMLAIESFAWAYFDSLKLNQMYRPANINNKMILAGEGTFQNKEIQLVWTGISRMNDEICALIEYRTMDNPLAVDTEQLKIKGRSHYWGTIWVSLTDKQIEHATLYEDVVMDMTFANQPNQLINTTRIIQFEKLN
jgi:hypothetical protein